MTKENQSRPLKILLAGDSGAGKTSLLCQLTRGEFDPKCAPTNGGMFDTHSFLVDNQIIKTEIWDIAGREEYRSLAKSLFHNIDGIMLIYDISNDKTFQNLGSWLEDIIQLADPKTVVHLFGNKNDLDSQRSVAITQAEQFASDHGLFWMEISALDGNNMDLAFRKMIKEIHASKNSKDDSIFSTCSTISCHKAIDNQLMCPFKNLACQNDTEEEPFHIVLVDIKKAAHPRHPTIHCITRPLLEGDDSLKYVALSYRWGELQETIIDTKVGYAAVVKSFELIDFYQLCHMMTKEKDFRHIKYVWVDALCIDQTNYERRKATIHQMSNIYDRAQYILAVPDLHAAYVKRILTMGDKTMHGSCRYKKDLYHLIHGNVDQLAQVESSWLDIYKVPNDPTLRHLLKSSTAHFTDGFTTYRPCHYYYNAEEALTHINETTTIIQQKTPPPPPPPNDDDDIELERLHHCDQVDCPLDLNQEKLPKWREDMILMNPERHANRPWKQWIYERSTDIRSSMSLMSDLIKDWSTRVWVISEYNIAKKKNNMKYWFIQLEPHLDEYGLASNNNDEPFSFFQFDFNDPCYSSSIPTHHHQTMDRPLRHYYNHLVSNEPVFITFHHTLYSQLNEQSFFEMMLKSKASKHEDRFYAILPLTKYKSKMSSKAADWKIDTIVSVRVKLFELMDTKDKLNFLFLSAKPFVASLGDILPSWATSSLYWDIPTEYFVVNDDDNDDAMYNFDLTMNGAITLETNTNNDLMYLNLKPKEYFVGHPGHIKRCYFDGFKKGRDIWRKLQYTGSFGSISLVGILSLTHNAMQSPFMDDINLDKHVIYLLGNFKENIWVVVPNLFNRPLTIEMEDWNRRTLLDHHSVGFNIY